ncbi:MAG: hypothetical protein ACI915_004471 [Gammaproteobacteria bacterium]|jgi:hypothetical protein
MSNSYCGGCACGASGMNAQPILSCPSIAIVATVKERLAARTRPIW